MQEKAYPSDFFRCLFAFDCSNADYCVKMFETTVTNWPPLRHIFGIVAGFARVNDIVEERDLILLCQLIDNALGN